MARETTGERLARLEERTASIDRSIEELKAQGAEVSANGRQSAREREVIRSELAATRDDIAGLHAAIAGITPTTDEYKQVRDKVVFAGRLGRTVWAIGRVVLSAAAGAAAAWYAMTGRTPPDFP
jgi:uncharacterized coiled-coil protein SlyX